METNKQFEVEKAEVRAEFARVMATYSVSEHKELRTVADTLLIMYDQMGSLATRAEDAGVKMRDDLVEFQELWNEAGLELDSAPFNQAYELAQAFHAKKELNADNWSQGKREAAVQLATMVLNDAYTLTPRKLIALAKRVDAE